MSPTTGRPLGGRVAIVTGGSQGIGRAVSEAFVAAGARVAVVARGQELVDETVEVLRAAGGEAIGISADVSSEADTERYVAATIDAFGGIDVLVNSAGTIAIGPTVDTSLETWEQVFAVNVTGTFLGCRAVAQQLIRQGRGGSIVNISSGAGQRGGASIAAYSASKAAVIGFTQSLAEELAPQGIRVNACCPGHVVETPMWGRIDAEVSRQNALLPGEAIAAALSEVPLARSGTPAEIASTVVFLASDAASYVTGESLLVDGGLLRR